MPDYTSLSKQELVLELERLELEGRVRLETARRTQALATFGSVLPTHLEIDPLLDEAARACRTLADVCVIHVCPVPDGEPFAAVVHPSDEQAAGVRDEAAQGQVPRALHDALEHAHGEVQVISDDAIAGWLRLPPRGSAILLAPLLGRERALGWLLLARTGEVRSFHEADVVWAREVAQLVALTVDNVRLYQQALRNVRAREDFVALISHDLVNANMSVRLSCDNVISALHTEAPDGPAVMHAARLEHAARWTFALTNKLLDVARLESEKFLIELHPELVTGLFEGAVQLVALYAREKRLRIECTEPLGLYALADRDRLTRVLLNLLNNAVRFSPVGGTIRLSAEKIGGEVVICIADQGPGIPEADIPFVFDRFWQAQRAPRAGVGLGLAIARALVEEHRGRIWVESERGQGSKFLFTLKRASTPMEETETVAPANWLTPTTNREARENGIASSGDERPRASGGDLGRSRSGP